MLFIVLSESEYNGSIMNSLFFGELKKRGISEEIEWILINGFDLNSFALFVYTIKELSCLRGNILTFDDNFLLHIMQAKCFSAKNEGHSGLSGRVTILQDRLERVLL